MLIENIKFSVPTINIIRIMQSLGLRPRLFSISHNSHYVKWKHNFFFKTQIIEDRDKYRLIKE